MPGSSGRPRFRPGSSAKNYFILNVIFTGVILLIMGYSAFYSPDTGEYPVACIHEKITGEPCPSCGLSHAFSLIVRGRVAEALEWNSASLRVFLFFAVQLVMRAGLGVWILQGGRRAEAAGNGRGAEAAGNGRASEAPGNGRRAEEAGKSAVTGQLSRLRLVTAADAVISSAMALYAFYPFLRATWLSLF